MLTKAGREVPNGIHKSTEILDFPMQQLLQEATPINNSRAEQRNKSLEASSNNTSVFRKDTEKLELTNTTDTANV